MNELVCKVQAVLFASGDFVSVDRLMQITAATEKDVRAAIDAVKSKFASEEFAMHVQEENDAYKFAVQPKYLPTVERLFSQTELTKSVMETLAVIAWKSPVMQAELVKIRSNKAYDHIAELVEKGFVTKEKAGRSYTIKLTQKFYNYFDVSSREDVQEVFDDIESKPRNRHIIPQRKVIDFDGKPRSVAKLTEKEVTELQVMDSEESKRQLEVIKAQQKEEINEMKSAHVSILDDIEQQLTSAAKSSDVLVQDIESEKPQEEKSSIEVLNEKNIQDKQESLEQEQPEESVVEQEEPVVAESAPEPEPGKEEADSQPVKEEVEPAVVEEEEKIPEQVQEDKQPVVEAVEEEVVSEPAPEEKPEPVLPAEEALQEKDELPPVEALEKEDEETTNPASALEESLEELSKNIKPKNLDRDPKW